jgi:virginiamycin B lyase
VTELTGGVTPGFSPTSNPDGITVGPDGHIWFTEFSGPGGSSFQDVGPGGVGRVNDDGTVTELVGGKTPGFDRQGGPEAITTGPDRRLWFAAYLTPAVSASSSRAGERAHRGRSAASPPRAHRAAPRRAHRAGGSAWFTSTLIRAPAGGQRTVHELRGG